jgi:hypothetical protein
MIDPGEMIDPGPSLVFGPLEAEKITAKGQDPISVPVAAMNGRLQNERLGNCVE